jgi:hypothetical protein
MPASAGHLTLPLDGFFTGFPGATRAIAVRVINALTTGAPGLISARVVVESYDTGVLDDVPATPDASAD